MSRATGGRGLPEGGWAALHARLEESRRRLEPSAIQPRDTAGHVLRRRAELLARPVDVALPRAPATMCVLFSAGDARFALDGRHVAEVWRPPAVTRVPCTPAFVAGVANYRGELLPILDLASGWRPEQRDGRTAHVVVAAVTPDLLLGLWADGLPETVELAPGELAPLDAVGGTPRSYGRGVTPSGICVIDAAALADAAELTVQEEVFAPIAMGESP